MLTLHQEKLAMHIRQSAAVHSTNSQCNNDLTKSVSDR